MVNNHGTVTVIDTATNKVTATVPVGADSYGIAISPDGRQVYVANSGSANVTVISTSTSTVTATVPVGAGPRQIAFSPDGSTAYVDDINSNTITPWPASDWRLPY